MSFIDQFIKGIRKRLNFLLPAFVRKGLVQYEPRPLTVEKDKVDLAGQSLLISIVIPSYNQGCFLERTINSILNQKYPKLELIIVDGGSTDESLSIIKKYESHLHWWCSQKDNGQANAVNKGFKHANGEILAWLNADDCYSENTLSRISNYFSLNETADVVYGNRILIDKSDLEIGRWLLPPHDNKVLSWADFIPQETLFWRRNLWNRVGSCLDESFDFAMDWDLLIRFRDANAHMVRLPFFLGQFRVHQGQKTSLLIDKLGFKEMQRLRYRCQGYSPSKFQCLIGLSKYLIMARLYDIYMKIFVSKFFKS